jgi:Kef-type K+ transport system membrane component KefB
MHESILLPIALMLAFAKLGGELCERYLKQPAVLAEIVVGVLLGGSFLGWVNGNNITLQEIAEVGAVLLLFEVGLESDIDELFKVGKEALWVAIVGVIAPFVLGYLVAHSMGLPSIESIFVGATLTATSVGITARVFSDLRTLHTREAKIVLGAAVADDVIGLVILAAVSGLAATKTISIASVSKTTGIALLFLVGAVVLGLKATPLLLKWARAMKTRAAVSSAAVVLCLLTAVVAQFSGLAPIVGAFACGLVLAKTEDKVHFDEKVRSIADLFVPVFFVMMGARMNLQSLTPQTIGVGALLLIVAIVGKVIAGLSLPSKRIGRWIIAVGMIPRGEVGLIFASIGLSTKVINEGLYASIVFVVIVTTFMTPPLLKLVAKLTPELEAVPT